MLTVGSIFCGMGDVLYACDVEGLTPMWAIEPSLWPRTIASMHYPDAQFMQDVREINGALLPPVDVITLRCPHMDSTVGSPFWHATRIIHEMRVATNGRFPVFVVWEGLKFALKFTEGETFRRVLGFLLRFPSIPSIAHRFGFCFAGMVASPQAQLCWRQFNALHWGIPQNRERVFIVCDFGGRSAARILYQQDDVQTHNSVQRWQEAKLLSTTSKQSTGIASSLPRAGIPEHLSDVVVSLQGKQGASRVTYGTLPSVIGSSHFNAFIFDMLDGVPMLRGLTSAEWLRVIGMPEDWAEWPAMASAEQREALNMAIIVPVARYIFGEIVKVLKERQVN